MTTQINPNDTFLGFPATKLKALFSSWGKGNTEPYNLAKLKTLGLSSGACAAFIGESFDRGLIVVSEPEKFFSNSDNTRDYRHLQLSDAGAAVVSASARKRSSKAKATDVLNKLLANASRLSKDRFAPEEVDQIWVFGSFIDKSKADVGDLDVVISTRRTSVGKDMELGDQNRHIDRHYPGVVPSDTQYADRTDKWLNRMIFGKRRDALISRIGMNTLVDLHQPCRLVYDASLGGKITPQDFEYHPASKKRADHIKERLVMPTLGNLPEEFSFTTAAVYMWAPEIADRKPAVIGKRVLTDQDIESLGFRCLDGMSGFAMVVEHLGCRGLFHVAREVNFSDKSDWNYTMKIEAIVLDKEFDPGFWQCRQSVQMVESLFSADILRLTDRRHKLGVFNTISADIDFCEKTQNIPEMAKQLHELTSRITDQRFGVLLPEGYKHSLDIYWRGEFLDGLGEPWCYDEEDWLETSISKESYEAWCESISMLKEKKLNPSDDIPRP